MAKNEAFQIAWVPIEQVSLNPANPRHNDEAVEHVAASIRRFGFQQPLVVKPSGEVIAGNTRLKAARTLGLATVPIVHFEGSDLEATAFGIADNRTHEFATWDDKALVELLETLRREDALDGVGYTAGDIDSLLDELQAAAGAGEVDLDQIPLPPETATTRKGDLWILGSHRLLCGDSASPADVDRLLAGASVHLVCSDPPFNVKVEPRSNNAIAAGLSSFTATHHQKLDVARHPDKAERTTTRLRAKDRPLTNDFMDDAAFAELLAKWFGNFGRVLLPGRGFYLWGGYSNIANYPAAMKNAGLYFSQAIIWVKGHPVLTRKDFMGDHEWCFYGWREGAAHQFFGPNNATDIWEVKKVSPQAMQHLTQKPVELASRAILYSSRRGENILDLFGGSGSTLIACEETQRNGFLMEIDDLYCDVILTRWKTITGKDPTLEASGETFSQVAAVRGTAKPPTDVEGVKP